MKFILLLLSYIKNFILNRILGKNEDAGSPFFSQSATSVKNNNNAAQYLHSSNASHGKPQSLARQPVLKKQPAPAKTSLNTEEQPVQKKTPVPEIKTVIDNPVNQNIITSENQTRKSRSY